MSRANAITSLRRDAMPGSFDPATAPRRRSATTQPAPPAGRPARKSFRDDPSQLITPFRWLAMAWLFMGLPIAHLISPAFNDFSQFYYGSLVVREHAWDALYAIPAS